MKLKVLLVPFFLVLAVGLVVWLVMPKYYDDKLKRQELKMETEKLNSAVEKVEKVNTLMADLGANADKQAILFSFLPETQKEEEVINDLNIIASSESVAIKNLTVAKAQASAPAVSETKTDIKTPGFDLEFTVVGPYDKIKNVVDRLSKIKRFNKISSLTIAKTTSKNEKGEEVAGSNLQAKIVLTFNYSKKADAVSISSDIFSQNKFDMSVIAKINSLRTTDTAKISSVSGGRENPFLP
jgi:hypothetical protein